MANDDDILGWKWGQMQAGKYSAAAKAGRGGIDWSSYWTTREPSGISVAQADTTATVTWTDSAETGADGYKVYAGAVLKATVAVGVQTANITGLTALTEYVFKVVAYKGTEESTGITSTKTTYKYLYVRPAGGSYGAEDGSNYDNAYDGFADISWAAVVPNTVVWICGTHTEALTVGASGTAALHIIFRGDYPADPGIIDGEDTDATCVTVSARNYTEWRNLNILQATSSCINFAGGTHWMYDCEITDSGDQNTEVNTAGIVYLTRCTIERGADDGSSAHDTGRYFIDDCDYNANATAIDSASSGLQTINNTRFNSNTAGAINSPLYTAHRCYIKTATSGAIGAGASGTFSYCLIDVRAYTTALEMMFSGAGTMNLDNCTIIADNVGYIREAAGYNRIFRNCIIYDLYRIGSNEAGTLTTNKCNLFSSTILNIDTNTDEVAGDPLFTNFGADDFTLQVGSPCRDVGLTGLGYTTDYAGNPVPATGVDVGCYQN